MVMNIPFPGAAARSFLALRVADSGCDPLAIFLVIPFLGLLSVYNTVSNCEH